MQRIDNSSAAASLPTIPVEDTPGFFTDGDPGGGIPATIVDASWANSVQEEIIQSIEEAGLTPDKADIGQLKEAIKDLGLVGVTDFMTSGQSLSNNGFQKFPGGLIVQWGKRNDGNGASIPFQISFPTSVLSITFGCENAGGVIADSRFIQHRNLTTSGFDMHHTRYDGDTAGALDWNYIAVGF